QNRLGSRKDESHIFELVEEFISTIPIQGRVLDAGCGNGAYSRYLSEKFEVTGLDISENQIELAHQNAPKAKFICIDITKVEFPDDFFDGIFSFYTIIHIPRDEHYNLLENFYRILKNDGVVLLNFHIYDDPESYVDDFLGSGLKMYWSGFDRETNLKMLSQVGFNIIWTKIVKESPKFGNASHYFVFAKKLL
ncbi:MAG: class I SAM-dependent methyltransferase, partial [Candidatus Lokiarchaeota archaeon]